MYTSFENLPEGAKVWVYQTEQKLTDTQADVILKRAKDFINSWQSHGHDLKGSVNLLYGHFLVLGIDETYSSASGCSIDKSVHFIQELERELGISFMNRVKQSYLEENIIRFFPISDAKKLIKEGVLNKNTLTFNNTITNKSELNSNWQIPADRSWLGRFFDKV